MVVKAQGGYHTLIQLGRPNLSQFFLKKNSLCEVAFAPEVFYGDFGEEFVFFSSGHFERENICHPEKHWGFWQYNSL